MKRKLKILLINGPNINMLGIREPSIYGNSTYQDLVNSIQVFAEQKTIEVVCKQSNHEGVIVDIIQDAHGVFDGIVINPAAYTHYSIAILDALKAVGLPAIEVHISDIKTRESFRTISYPAMACIEQISGLGFDGYIVALERLLAYLNEN